MVEATDAANPKPLYILGTGKTARNRQQCKFFAAGSCAAGDLCPFEHGAVFVPTAVCKSPVTIGVCKSPVTIGVCESPVSNSPSDLGGTTAVKMSYSQLAGMSSGLSSKTATTTIIDCDSNNHIPPAHHTQPPSRATLELCVFAVTGKCRFGTVCRNVHGLQCPRCLLYCLHPTDLEQNEEHIRECLEKPVKASNLEDEDLECGICLEKVLSKADPRFGLLNCEHAFCLSCIRQWRATCQQGVNDPTQVRSCPLCRTVTYFIVPCSQFIRDGDEKGKVIEQFKRKVQSIPCRHYDYGKGRCPFGSSCFYSHLLMDGSLGPVDQPRSYVDANEQVKVVREFRLSDFLPVNHS